MDQTVINLIFGAIMTGVGWWCREIWTSIQQLRHDLQALEVSLPKEYAAKADIDRRFDKIDKLLDDIWRELKDKADKHDGH